MCIFYSLHASVVPSARSGLNLRVSSLGSEALQSIAWCAFLIKPDAPTEACQSQGQRSPPNPWYKQVLSHCETGWKATPANSLPSPIYLAWHFPWSLLLLCFSFNFLYCFSEFCLKKRVGGGGEACLHAFISSWHRRKSRKEKRKRARGGSGRAFKQWLNIYRKLALQRPFRYERVGTISLKAISRGLNMSEEK